MGVLKNLNIGLTFLLELAMLVEFGYWGFFGGNSGWLRWVLGIGLPLAAAILWGFRFAPRAVRRLGNPGGPALSALLFLLAAAALIFAQQRELAVILAFISVVNRILVLAWRQW